MIDKFRNRQFLMFNIFIIVFLIAFGGVFLSIKRMYNATKDFREVDVIIDDISFESDGVSYDSDGDPTYKFKMNRILHFTYNGTNYDVENTRRYSSSSTDFKVEPRTNYKDDGTYKINPANPRQISITRGIDEGTVNNIANVMLVIIAFCVVALVLGDVIYVFRGYKSREDIFDK